MPPSGRPAASTPHALVNALGSPQKSRDFLRQLAEAVALGAKEHDAAKASAAAAAARVLEAVLADVAPALPHLATKVAVSGRLMLRGDGGNKDEVRTFAAMDGAEVRALHVAGDATPVKLAETDSSRGTFTGRGLWLTDAGRFLELRFAGAWASQPERREWSAEVLPMSPAEAMGQWKLEDVVEGLAGALHRHQREEPTQTAQRRAHVLDAIRTLLSASK
jgi:hypothetical protein